MATPSNASSSERAAGEALTGGRVGRGHRATKCAFRVPTLSDGGRQHRRRRYREAPSHPRVAKGAVAPSRRQRRACTDAYRLLLENSCRSWLYISKEGATTENDGIPCCPTAPSTPAT